jgi:outer membrane protein TolC
MKARVPALALVMAMVSPIVLPAADPEPSPSAAPDPAASASAVLVAEPVLTLTMSDAVVRGLDANLDVQIERLQPAIAEQERRYRMGAFDPHLTGHYTYESLETPQNTRDFFATGRAVEVMDEENIRTETNLVGLLPTGTRYKVTVVAYSLKNTLNREALARFYPEYTTTTSLTVTQPLFRGGGHAGAMSEADIAKSDLRVSEYALRGKIDQIASQVLDAYVEAVYGEELIRVISDRISLASRLRDENEKRLKQGLMAPIDVMQAESTKAAAEIELVRARNFLIETENRLRELIFTDFAQAADTPFRFVDVLNPVTINESLRAVRGLALDRSMEYQVALQKIETSKLELRHARNMRLPTLDLEASVGLNGLGGTLSDGFSDYSNRTQPDYSVGLVADIPISFHAERAQLAKAMLSLRQAELDAKRTANRVISQVQTAYARVQSAIERTEASSRAVKTARETLGAEEKRLTNGLTTSFNVLKLQDELAQAHINRLEAVAEGHKALIVLWSVSGVLLDRYNITTVEAPSAKAQVSAATAAAGRSRR